MTSITNKLGVNNFGMYFDPSKFSFDDFKKRWDYDLDAINKLPINWIRIGYTYYDRGINDDGSYNFDRLDYAVESAQKIGLKVILPIWFVDDGLDDGLVDKVNIDYKYYYSAWLDMIRSIVKRYAGLGLYYEAIDEATSGGHFWLNKPITGEIINDIVNMNRQFDSYVKAYDSDARFITGDFAAPSKAADEAIEKGLLDFGDYVSYHPYMTEPESMIDGPAQVEFRKKLGKTGLKLSATEFGFGVPTAFNGANTSQQQASKLLRQILILDMLGFEHIIQFTMDGSDTAWVLQDSNGGELNESGKAIQALMFELTGFIFVEKLKSDSGDYVFKYSKNDEFDKAVYWTTKETHTCGNYIFTQMPKIKTLNTVGRPESEYPQLELERLDSRNILANYQKNIEMINDRSAKLNKFLSTYGFKNIYNVSDNLSYYKKMNREFIAKLSFQLKSLKLSIAGVIRELNQNGWIDVNGINGDISGSIFNGAELVAVINKYWNWIEKNINDLLLLVNRSDY